MIVCPTQYCTFHFISHTAGARGDISIVRPIKLSVRGCVRVGRDAGVQQVPLFCGLCTGRYHGESLLSKPPRSQLLTSRALGHLNSTLNTGARIFLRLFFSCPQSSPAIIPSLYGYISLVFWPFPLPCVVKTRLIVPL